MDTLQFSLFFVALLLGYVLVHLRMVRFEEHLQKLAGIRGLDDRLRGIDDRLQQMSEAFDRIGGERVEAHLERLHEDLDAVREATIEVRHAVVQIPAQMPAPPATSGEAGPTVVLPRTEPPAARTVAAIETRLLQLGYHNVRLLSDLRELRLADQVEVQVECERGGMPVKGRVLVHNGSVRDVVLQPVTQMFP